MRKPRDYEAELKALEDRARDLRTRKVAQHGELVAATGADRIDVDLLAGGLIALTELADEKRKEQLRQRGAAFFRGRPRKAAGGTGGDAGGGAANYDEAQPAGRNTGSQ
jgi:hypothetical protein